MTPDHLHWMLDPVAWLREALSVEPDPWQADLLTAPAGTVLVLCGRQVGKSTSASWRALHRALFWAGSLVLLVAPSERQSGELMGKVRDSLGILPSSLRPRLREDNKLSLRFANGSRIVALPGDGRTVRGFSAPSLVVVDEAHYCSDELYVAVLPMLSTSHGSLIEITTANGQEGMFYSQWTDAAAVGVTRITIKSQDCPRVSRDHLTMMRRFMTASDFQREYECVFARKPGRLFSEEDFRNVLVANVVPVNVDAKAHALRI